MLTTLAIKNYRSLLDVVAPLSALNVITGANGSGKSNMYKALRLLAETADGGVVAALAREGGLQSTYWAGPENLSRAMKQGVQPVQGGPLSHSKRMKLGFCDDEFGYLIELGLPEPSHSLFSLDPEIKRECIWAGPVYRAGAALVDRQGPLVKIRRGRRWEVHTNHVPASSSLFTETADPGAAPEVFTIREMIREWRFYDHFRTDREAPARQPQLATRTPVLHHDGRDFAAALQTIREVGNAAQLDAAVADAFAGASLDITGARGGHLSVSLQQQGLLRSLSGAELSDGTLRYLLWIAALLTPRPPQLMVLNEPETSLHPDLLPALARLIAQASEQCQVWVVTHSNRLINALETHRECHCLRLEKQLSETLLAGQRELDQPPWHWATR